ncbi:hypothetical protein IQ07DRAFT_421342 [Pyrenochaeta sp. DS3sAY3a]|nr:hypothetical protein IQ07DRAFT_421342 [Pyrenochaeta sp. DS3sAY3a]
MKENPNVIFTIKATNLAARQTYKFLHNSRFYVAPKIALETTNFSRECTPLTSLGDEHNEDDGDQFCFTFDKRPRDIKQGYVFGSNPKTCDILLGTPMEGISGSHFRVTFDNQGTLVLIDSSTHGTAVSHDGQLFNEKRNNLPRRERDEALNGVVNKRDSSKDFTWILSPETNYKQIILGNNLEKVPRAQMLQFSVEVTNPKTVSLRLQYVELRNAYLQDMRTAIYYCGLNAIRVSETPFAALFSALDLASCRIDQKWRI